MLKKNLLYIISALSLCFALSACKNNPQPTEQDEKTQQEQQQAPQATEQKADQDTPKQNVPAESKSIYDFTVKSWDGKDISLKEYQGKMLLIVNTATACGFTPQYEGLEELYQKYFNKGIAILDFPCNQFGQQAPGTDQEIHEFRDKEYKVTFPQFAKIDVNGKNADPLFKYLVSLKGFQGFNPDSPITPVLEGILSKENPNYKDSPDIKWNFTKFLFDENGKFIDRYEPTTTPAELDKILYDL